MNKHIINSIFIVSCISFIIPLTIHTSERKRKRTPSITIAEIPPFKRIRSNNIQNIATKKNSTLLDLCKADDTTEFENLYQKIAAEGTQFNHAYVIEDDEGNMPLHIACCNGNTRMVQLLLPHTSNINKPNNKKETSLHLTCKSKKKEKIEIAKLLCQTRKIDYSLQDQTESTVLHIACKLGKATLVEIILNSMRLCSNRMQAKVLALRDEIGSTVLNNACMFKNIEAVRLLLEQEFIYPNTPQFDGTTPLHTAIELRCYPIIELLLAHKRVNPNQQDKTLIVKCRKVKKQDPDDRQWYEGDEEYAKRKPHNTPLHFACFFNDIAAVTLLLMHKTINPYIENGNKLKPLHIAQQFKSRHIKQQRYNQTIIKLFQDYEAQLKALNK